MFNALFEAASKISRQERNPCTILPSNAYLKNAYTATVHLRCGGLHVTVTRTEFTDDNGKRRTDYDVSETTGTVRTGGLPGGVGCLVPFRHFLESRDSLIWEKQ